MTALNLMGTSQEFVIAHFHLVMGVAAFFGMFAGIYHWFPKMFGRYMNNTLGYIHFFVTFICSYAIFWPMHYSGLAGMPRRYYDFTAWATFAPYQKMNSFISIFVVLAFFTQLLFIFNFFVSIFRGRKVTSTNPWGCTTLEWTTPIVPGHGNWEGPIPEVHRWAYEFRDDEVTGLDYVTQTTPLRPGEVEH